MRSYLNHRVWHICKLSLCQGPGSHHTLLGGEVCWVSRSPDKGMGSNCLFMAKSPANWPAVPSAPPNISWNCTPFLFVMALIWNNSVEYNTIYLHGAETQHMPTLGSIWNAAGQQSLGSLNESQSHRTPPVGRNPHKDHWDQLLAPPTNRTAWSWMQIKSQAPGINPNNQLSPVTFNAKAFFILNPNHLFSPLLLDHT